MWAVMVATEQSLGPSVGPLPARAFDAKPATGQAELDRHLKRLKEHAREFARAPISRKLAWLKDVQERTRGVADDWVAAACRAKGLSLDQPVSGEEWIGGPALTLRNIRFLIKALEDVGRAGVPELDAKRVRELSHGAVSVGVSPYDSFDGALYGGLTGETWLQKGIGPRDVRDHQASFYKRNDPEGGVCLVLGAGNVASIAPMDVLQKLF